MKTRFVLLAAMVAFFSTMNTAQAQRKAEITRNNGNIQVRITEPSGVHHFIVFQGAGITGPVEVPLTLANCVNPVFITLGPVAAHNHFHTVVWVDCDGATHRWALPIPWNWQWLPGYAIAISTPVGLGCGSTAPLGLALDGPPTLGCVRVLEVTNVPPSTLFTLMVCSHSLASPAPSLASYGFQAPGCFAFVDLASALMFGMQEASGPSTFFDLEVPAYPWLEGCLINFQALTLSPGENPAGVITSNGLNLVLADW